MASIKKLDARKFKITVSNGYRPDGRKISRAKTITVPQTVGGRGISQYVAHEAEEFEKQVKNGYCEDGEMTFQEYAARWLERQTRYPPAHRSGKYAGRVKKADLPWQTNSRGNCPEILDSCLCGTERCEAKRDH